MASHTIVIIGASFAGLTVAQNLLKDILPHLGPGGKQSYKVVLISPSEDFFWKIGAPRTLVHPEALPLEKTLLPIAPRFNKYSAEQYQFIKAFVTAIEPSSKTVQLSTSSSVQYDSLVICSGTSFATPLWSVSEGTEALRDAISELHQKLPAAQTVLVGGGGPAGVETAGELGNVYGGKKDITILSGTHNLLGSLQNQSIGKDAQARLEKMGVKVVNDGVRVTSHTKDASGKDVLQLSNGETKIVDVYIEATGDRPNSKFVPKEWLDDRNRVKTDPNTLRLNVPGVTGVYCYGTVASYSNGSIADVMFAKKAVLESIKLDLQGQQPGPRTKNVYKKMTSDFQIVPIGPSQGVGTGFGFKLPSFMVKMIKSKDFMIGNAVKYMDGTA